ncbi:MAG: cytochrome b5 domain-containing protein [Candidatus Woesearchaeota archaeon]
MKKFLFLAFLAIFIVGCSTPIDNVDMDEPTQIPQTEEESGEIVETSSDNEVVESVEEDVVEDESFGITRDELSENNNGDSCWVAYQGQVYDLTDWLRQHPGGAQSILPNCGTAEQFEEAYNERHGERDSGLLRNQPIGEFNG